MQKGCRVVVQSGCLPRAATVPIMTICGILTFALGVWCYFCKTFPKTPKNGKKTFAIFFLQNSLLRNCFWLPEPKKSSVFFAVGLLFWGGGGALVLFILVLLKRTWATLDSGIAVHTSTSIQSGSVGLWDCSPQHRHADQQSSVRDDSCLSQNHFVDSPITVHLAHQMLKQFHRKQCESIQR